MYSINAVYASIALELWFNENLSHALAFSILTHIRSNWSRYFEYTKQALEDIETDTLFHQKPPTLLSLLATSEIFQIQIVVTDLNSGQKQALTPDQPEKLFFVLDSRGFYFIDPNKHSGFSLQNSHDPDAS